MRRSANRKKNIKKSIFKERKKINVQISFFKCVEMYARPLKKKYQRDITCRRARREGKRKEKKKQDILHVQLGLRSFSSSTFAFS